MRLQVSSSFSGQMILAAIVLCIFSIGEKPMADLLTPLTDRVHALETKVESDVKKFVEQLESPFTTVIKSLEARVTELEAKISGDEKTTALQIH